MNGAGSSFQNTYQQAAIQAFKSASSGITVNYNSVGSGTGRSDLYSNTVLYAGSDSPIPASEASKVPAGKTVLYFPVVIGPISLAYNLPGVSSLKLTPTVIAKIFQGQIKSWNDPAIAAINPGVTLPSTAVTIAVRSDSSGTTQNFALFLKNAVPSVWTLGSASTVKWPSTAHAGAQNTGVASIVKSTPGAIGYVDYSDAKASGLVSAWCRTRPATTSPRHRPGPPRTRRSHHQVGPHVRRGQRGTTADSYPVTSQSWDLVYAQQPNANDAAMLKSYIGYLLGAASSCYLVDYAPLPSSLDRRRRSAEPDHLVRMTFMTQAALSPTGLSS